MLKRLRVSFWLFFILASVLLLTLTPPPASATSFTDAFENVNADHLFRGTSFSESTPASFYVSLHITSCTDSAVGTEVSGGSYARIAVARSQAAWNGTHGTNIGASSGTNGTISNNGAIDFAAPTANWGLISSFGINSALTGGVQYVCEDLTTPKTVNNGDAAPSFAPAALTIQVDN